MGICPLSYKPKANSNLEFLGLKGQFGGTTKLRNYQPMNISKLLLDGETGEGRKGIYRAHPRVNKSKTTINSLYGQTNLRACLQSEDVSKH